MAKQAKFEDVTIPIFDGINYSSWKFRLLTLLEYKECNNQALRDMSDTDKEVEWKKKDLKARNILISTISDKQLEYVRECTTAREMIKSLDRLYETQSTSMQIICRAKIEEIKLKDFEDIEEFFVKFEKAVNNFKLAGGKLDEEEKLRYLIKSLPANYSYIGDFIDVIPEKDRTVDYVKSKIKEKNLSRDNSEKRSNVSTFATRKDGCFNCGKFGHYQKDCWRARNSNKQQSSEGQRGNHRGNFRGRGRGRGRGSNQINRSTSENQESSEMWSTQVRISEGYKVTSYNVNTERQNVLNWLLDSGCTDHIVRSDRYFENFVMLRDPVDVKLPDNKSLKATKVGNVKIEIRNKYNKKQIDLKNVYYVEGIKQNLLSFSRITEKAKIIARYDKAKIYNEKKELVAVANKIDNLYYLKSYLVKNRNDGKCVNSVKLTNKEKWHRALGHINFNYLNKLANKKLVNGLPENLENINMKCATCIESKMTNVPFENNRTKTKEILELIHTDLNGPHKTTGYGGEKYFLTFIDDYSKCTRIFCIKNKSETLNCFKEFINLVENKFNKRIKKLRCDNGREYMNHEFHEFVKSKGIELSPCPPYVHELNGIAERYNRSAMDMGRCLMKEAKINKMYWPEIMKTVAYLKNRTIANTLENKTPYEIFFGEKPNVKNLKIYGSRVFVRIPEVLRKSKWDDKAKLGVLVGYTENGYRVLVNNKIINARHVNVIEESIKLICLENDENDSENNVAVESDEVDNSVFENDSHPTTTLESGRVNKNENVNNNENSNVPITPRRSERKKSPVSRYGNPIAHCIYVNHVDANIPYTFEEAINCKDSKNWQEAMNREIECIKKNKTWELVDKVKDKKVLDVKWVYAKKSNNRYKARLVVRGFQQTNVSDDIYSPVAKNQTLKVLFSICCQYGLKVEQMDVEAAFLNGKVTTEVYIRQPKGYEKEKTKVCKLLKALYGLKESSRDWYECLDEYLTSLDFERSDLDLCLYVNKRGDDIVYILVYVDDLLICSKNKILIQNVKELLSKKFQMKDLGEIKEYLGINIKYDYKIGKMDLNQENYIESLADKYQIKDSRLYNTPMETNLKIEKSDEYEPDIKYRNLIGALLYISSGTRPDISYSVNYLSRFQNCYTETHWKYALRILKYLHATKELCLKYKRNENCDLVECYVDADWAGDNIDRKSTSGYVIKLFGNVIEWKSRKQKCITKASTYAEYVALSEAVSELKFIKELLKIFDVTINDPIKIYEDNTGAINIANCGNFTKNSKHVEIHYHFVHESVKVKEIEIVKVNSKENVADIFTKALCRESFIKFRNLLNVK